MYSVSVYLMDQLSYITELGHMDMHSHIEIIQVFPNKTNFQSILGNRLVQKYKVEVVV